MDLLNEIKRRALEVPESERPGINAIVRHLEQAERCLLRGREGEDDYFTDVVYRTNHAYEGALKEAYEKLTGKDASQKTPHEIENHLEKSDLLRSRVIDLMRNYRKEWRNPSTHEYELFFNGQEALLAIISVSAFVAVLLDQIVDAIQVREQEPAAPTHPVKDPDITEAALHKQVVELIQQFVLERRSTGTSPHTERYFEAAIAHYLMASNLQLEVLLEPAIEHGLAVIRPDMLIRRGNELVVLEIKRMSTKGVSRAATVKQVLFYAAATNAKHAILAFIPDSAAPLKSKIGNYKMADSTVSVTELFPEEKRASNA